MLNKITIAIGKIVSKTTKSLGGGSALPGLVMEKINPDFIKNALADLPYGVVVISGTNGKTSTTKMTVELFKKQGLTVFTNNTGSNFLRGVGSSLLAQVDSNGKLAADVAVLELDEAHAVHFVKQIQPSYSLLLNVMRDQLDRFGELDNVANMLQTIAQKTSQKVVINRHDSHLLKIGQKIDNACYYGFSEKIEQKFSTLDDEQITSKPDAELELIDSSKQRLILKVSGNKISAKTKINGVYNHYNLTGAMLLVKTILKDQLDWDKLKTSLAEIKPAFGRGETFVFDGQQIQLILVKNPSGFQMSLNSLIDPKAEIMIAINDNYADGRDVSWLWDVDFSVLPKQILATTGSRSKDIANRLKYDQKSVSHSDSDIKDSLDLLLKSSKKNKQIFTTYTAMLKIRKLLKKAQGSSDGKFD